MNIPLPIHLLIHFSLAILSGYMAGRHFKKLEIGILLGFIGGFLIDLDHVLEYLIVFSGHFNLRYFLQGRQFLVSDQIHLWFHAWEYVPILIIFGLLLKKRKTLEVIAITLAFAMGIHLITDSIINRCPPKFYSLAYRASLNFSSPKLMSIDGYQENLKLKQELGL
ncbi:MAG: hypothetical protein WCN88_03380 [Candidatus Falkowbacteria bacterium]